MDKSTKNKFSRQIGAVGRNTMQKLMDVKVLLIGAESVGLECAKCLSLLGINTLHILDNDKLTKKKAINLYYINNKAKKLSDNVALFSKELNQGLHTEVWSKLAFQKIIDKNIDIVIVTKIANHDITGLDKLCAEKNIKFVMGLNYELEGYIFSNFNSHTILDKDGEFCVSGFVEDYIVDDKCIKINLDKLDNNIISNQGKLVCKDNVMNIQLESHSLTHIMVKNKPEIISFLEANNNIKFVETKETIHVKYKSFTNKIMEKDNSYIYLSDKGNIPTSHDKYNKFIENITLKKHNCAEFRQKPPFFILASIVGGIVSHEVIKVTGKYTPINQEIFLDYTNLMGKTFYKTANTRNATIFDRELIRKIKKQNIFMIGCGALGCELSKNLGMIDACTNVNSSLFITDMDNIELSNLNRQFLFDNNDIGKSKSDTVRNKLKTYTPNMKVINYNFEVGKKTENIFNSNFWNENDIIINALDNTEARKYVDSRCVEFDKPLFESGTLGGKANTQTIIPYKTATYSELSDPEDKNIPMCTIKTFPNKIEHCIEWGLESFFNNLTQPIQDLKKLVRIDDELAKELKNIDNQLVLKQRTDVLDKYVNLYANICNNTQDNLKSFFDLFTYIFETLFVNPIKDVLYTFPSDLKNKDGSLFWSGKKLLPKIINLKEIDNNFVTSVYDIISKAFNIECWSEELYNAFKTNYKSDNYVSKKLNIDESKDTIQYNANTVINSCDIDNMLIKWKNIVGNNPADINLIEYDKDDDITLEGMYHISNTRAEIYSIDKVDCLGIKLISGKIIPALSTTTTVISGFVIIELIKYLSGESYKLNPSDININLSINQYVSFESIQPKITYDNMFMNAYGMKVKTYPYKFNTWDKLRINTTKECCPDINELIEILNGNYKINVSMLTCGSQIVYNKLTKDNILINNLFEKLGISRSESIKLNIVAFNEENIPIITPPLILEN